MKMSVKSKLIFLSLYLIVVIAVLLCNNVITDFGSLHITERLSNATFSDQNNEYVSLTKGNVIEQPFIVNQDNTQSLQLYVQDYQKNALGKFQIVSVDDEDQKHKLNVNYSDENNCLTLTTKDYMKAGNYILSFECLEDIKVKAASSMDTNLSMRINENRANQCLEVYSTYSSNSFAFIILLLIAIIIPVILLFTCNKISWKTFLIYSVLYLLLFIFILPYPLNAEENYTAFNANTLNLNVFSKITDNTDGNKSAWLPSGTLNNTSLIYNKTENTSEDYSEYTVSHDGYDLQLQYQFIPSFISFKLSGLIGLSHYQSIALSRLLTSLIYVLVCSLAIYYAKRYKSIFFMIAASPLLMLKAATMSVDAIAFAFAALFLSICFRCIYDHEYRLNTIHILLLVLSLFVVSTYKYLILLPVSFLAFAIPGRAFPGKRKSIISWIFTVIVCACITLQLFALINNPEILAKGTNAFTESVKNTSFISILCGFITDAGTVLSSVFSRLLMPFANGITSSSVSVFAFTVCMFMALLLSSMRINKENDLEASGTRRIGLSAYTTITAIVLIICSFLTYIATREAVPMFNLTFIPVAILSLILAILAHCASSFDHDIIFVTEGHLTGALTLFSGYAALYYILALFGCIK